MTKLLNGKFFTCLSPGNWLSDDGMVSVRQVKEKRWTVYVEKPPRGPFLVGEGATMKDAVSMWAE